MKLARYPFVTGGNPVPQKKESKTPYDPYNKKNVDLLKRAYSIKADVCASEYALNDSTWD